MKKLLILGAFLGLFGTSNVFASEVENVNVPMEQVGVVTAEDHVDYWVTNIRTESEFGKYYLNFTVNWKYTGDREYPHIAFMVYIFEDQYERKSFLDSAIGIKEGSRDYKIEMSSYGNYSVTVNGSDGGLGR